MGCRLFQGFLPASFGGGGNTRGGGGGRASAMVIVEHLFGRVSRALTAGQTDRGKISYQKEADRESAQQRL